MRKSLNKMFDRKTIVLLFVVATCLVLISPSLTSSLPPGATGNVRVRNVGGYVARFTITFTMHGQRMSHSSGNFPAQQSRSLDIPYGASDISLKVDNCVFIRVWRNVFTINIPSAFNLKCFSIRGSTFHPGWSEISC